MYRRCKMLITAPTAAAFGHHERFTGQREIVHQLARLGIENRRPNRHLENGRLTVAPSAVRAFAMAAALRLVLRVIAKMDQRVVLLAGLHDHIAATAAIATRRTPARNKLLTPKRDATVAAIAGFDQNSCF